MNSGLQPEIIRGKYSITRYGESFIEINKVLITTSCIISTDNEPIPWQITNVEQLSKQEIGKFWPTVSNPPKSAITSALALAVRSSMLFGNLSSITADTGSFGRISGD